MKISVALGLPMSLFLAAILGLGMAYQAAETRPGDKAGSPAAKSTADQRQTAFKWFSNLGFLDAKDRKFVRVSTGKWFQNGDNPPRNSYVHGFLIKEKSGSFTVLTLSMSEETYHKTPAKTAVHLQVGFEVRELRTGAAAHLKALRAPPKDEDRDRRPLWGIDLHSRTQTFVLAWACWRNGLDELGAELFDQAAKTPTGYGYNPDQPPTQPLQKLIADDLAHTEMWRGVVGFGNAAMPRSQLLKRFERIVKHYPESKHHKDAKATVTLLEQMIEEDAVHEKKSAKPFDQLGKKDQIAELIFQLRDQNGHQYFQPGSCDIFDSWGRAKDTPAHKLVKMGYDAVPQLIDHLDDQRFTRSVGFHRNFYFSHHVLRVGDCAETIISRIAGRSFFKASSTNSGMTKDGKASETKKEISAWWKDVQKKGEKQVLIEGVEAGDRNSAEQAERLMSKFSKAAFDAIIKGINNAKDEFTKGLLVRYLAEIADERVVPFLRRQLAGRSMWLRITAAEELMKLKQDDGLKVMIQEWKDVSTKPDPETDSRQLSRFLIWSGRLEAVLALSKDLWKRSPKVRYWVVEGLLSEDRSRLGAKQPTPEPVKRAIDDLLARALDDTEQCWGVSTTWGGMSLNNPRICDIAGYVLSGRLKKDDMFDENASLRTRDQQRIALQNAWRIQRGMATVPVPPEKKIERLSEKQIAPLLQKVRDGKTAEARQAALQTVESLGLPALPALKEFLAGLKPGDPARDDVSALARRLAFIVADVTITEHSVKPTKDIQKRLDALKGKPVEPNAIVGLLASVLRALPSGMAGIEVFVEREGDDTGASVTVTLVPEERRPNDEQGRWEASEGVVIGKKNVHYHGYGGARRGSEEHWREYVKYFRKALDSPAEQRVLIRASSSKVFGSISGGKW